MSTATVVISTPLALYGNCAQAVVDFHPPSNIAGQLCDLQVTTLLAGNTATTQLASNSTYLVTCSLPQPHSFASVNHPVDIVVNLPDAIHIHNARNTVIAAGSTGEVASGLTAGQQQPHCLVEIPHGPEQVTFQLWSTTAAIPEDWDSLTLIMEITPV